MEWVKSECLNTTEHDRNYKNLVRNFQEYNTDSK